MPPAAATAAGRSTKKTESRSAKPTEAAHRPRRAEHTHQPRTEHRPRQKSARTSVSARAAAPTRGAAAPTRATAPTRPAAPTRAAANSRAAAPARVAAAARTAAHSRAASRLHRHPHSEQAARPRPLAQTRVQPRHRPRLDARLLDKVVRGRAWIPVLGVLLVGIVGMRVEVLKLGSGIGRSTQLASQLQSMNQVLRDDVSKLSSDQRIERLAKSYGMEMPGPMDDHFVAADGANLVSRAIKSISQPAPSTFLAGLEQEQADNLSTVNAGAPPSTVTQTTVDDSGAGTTTAGAAAGTDVSDSTGAAGTTAGSAGSGEDTGAPITDPATGGTAAGGVATGGTASGGDAAATGTSAPTTDSTSGGVALGG